MKTVIINLLSLWLSASLLAMNEPFEGHSYDYEATMHQSNVDHFEIFKVALDQGDLATAQRRGLRLLDSYACYVKREALKAYFVAEEKGSDLEALLTMLSAFYGMGADEVLATISPSSSDMILMKPINTTYGEFRIPLIENVDAIYAKMLAGFKLNGIDRPANQALIVFDAQALNNKILKRLGNLSTLCISVDEKPRQAEDY